MSNNGRYRRPHLPKITKVELSQVDVKKRTILAGIFLLIGVVAIGYGLFSLINTQPGWVEVSVSATEPNCSYEFTLMYDFSESGGSATAENKRLSLLYTEATRDAHLIFSPDEYAADNLFALNAAPGRAVKVAPALYDAFRLLEEQGDRSVYLAPVYTEYDRVFRAEGDGEAMVYDPACSEEAARLIRELAAFTSDPEHIRVEVLEEGCLKLVLSDAYREYAEENGIETFLEFGWLRNAFIADYLAQVLLDNGVTKGYLSSVDGFTRNLDSREGDYSVNIFHKVGNDLYIPARVECPGPVASVRLRAYPVDRQDEMNFHLYADGRSVSGYIDPADGMNKIALEDLHLLGPEKTCAQLALAAAPVFIAEELSVEALLQLQSEGIASVWCSGKCVCTTDPGLAVLMSDPGYTLSVVK